MAETDATFKCPNCGKAYRWNADVAGRKITCRGCDAKFCVPTEAGGQSELLEAPIPAMGEGDIYELDLPDDEPGETPAPAGGAAGGNGKCPNCNTAMKPGAVLCLNCGFNVREGKKVRTVVGEATGAAPAAAPSPASSPNPMVRQGVDQDALAVDLEEEHFRSEWVTPLILVGVGVLLILINAVALWPGLAALSGFSFGFSSASASYAGAALFGLAYAALRFVVQVPTLLIAAFVVSWFFGTNFGSLWSGLLKLAALALFTSGLVDIINTAFDYAFYSIGAGDGGCFMNLLRIFISIMIFDITAMKLFDIEQGEATVLWFVTVLLPIIFMIFLGGTILAMMA